MGAHPYWYAVKYRPNIDAALSELRDREFKAGRYNPVMPFIDFPITDASPAPGAQHDGVLEAFEAAAEDGTRSILDIMHVSKEPDFCAAYPLSDSELKRFYGTTQPTLAQVEENMDFLDDVERGHCVYIVCFTENTPTEIFFAGYSFD